MPPQDRPSGPPKTPTDIEHTAGWTEGTVTRVGPGPCYGMLTFDGVEYAMFSDANPQLSKGDHIRARLSENKRRIDCGSGKQTQINAVEHMS